MRRSAFLLAAVALAACDQTPSPPPPMPKLPFWGGTTSFSAESGGYDPNPALNAALTGLGMKAWRSGYPMAALHYKGNLVWDWSRSDKWWAALPTGMRPLIITSPYTDGPPADDATLASYMGQFAARYPGCDYELDNEPNLEQNWAAIFVGGVESWSIDQALNAYVAKHRLVIPAIRAADANARIISGGSSGVDMDWNGGLISRGFFASVDGCGVHPYDSDAGSVAQHYAPLVAALPIGTEIWSTEYGVADVTQVKPMYAAHAAMGSPYFCWYRAQSQVGDQDGNDWGLVNIDGTPNDPAYEYARAINGLP